MLPETSVRSSRLPRPAERRVVGIVRLDGQVMMWSRMRLSEALVGGGGGAALAPSLVPVDVTQHGAHEDLLARQKRQTGWRTGAILTSDDGMVKVQTN